MPEDYDNKLYCDFGVIEIEYPVSGSRIELAIRQGVSNKWAASVMTPAQARELAKMLLQAADVADGVPTRPMITDMPLQYVHLATDDLEFIPYRDNAGRFPMAGDYDDIEGAGADCDIERDNE